MTPDAAPTIVPRPPCSETPPMTAAANTVKMMPSP
jgi:hypothetical protein